MVAIHAEAIQVLTPVIVKLVECNCITLEKTLICRSYENASFIRAFISIFYYIQRNL